MKTFGGICLFFILVLSLAGVCSADNEKMILVISIEECKMRLYKVEDNERLLISEHVVSTVKKGVIHPQGKGKITKIEFNPTWYPTALTRETFKKKGIIIGSSVPGGHKHNYMGPFKISLSHSTHKGSIYRIHGTIDESTIGTRETGGCIRMYNDEGVEFAKTLLDRFKDVDVYYLRKFDDLKNEKNVIMAGKTTGGNNQN